MIKYVKRAMKNPISKQIKYYPMIAACTPITIKDVVAQIEKTSTVSSADIKATIDSLEFVVKSGLTVEDNAFRVPWWQKFATSMAKSCHHGVKILPPRKRKWSFCLPLWERLFHAAWRSNAHTAIS